MDPKVPINLAIRDMIATSRDWSGVAALVISHSSHCQQVLDLNRLVILSGHAATERLQSRFLICEEMPVA